MAVSRYKLLEPYLYEDWDNITKANGGHGDEAKVECIKEMDIFITTKEEGTNA